MVSSKARGKLIINSICQKQKARVLFSNYNLIFHITHIWNFLLIVSKHILSAEFFCCTINVKSNQKLGTWKVTHLTTLITLINDQNDCLDDKFMQFHCSLVHWSDHVDDVAPGTSHQEKHALFALFSGHQSWQVSSYSNFIYMQWPAML